MCRVRVLVSFKRRVSEWLQLELGLVFMVRITVRVSMSARVWKMNHNHK